MPDPAYNLLTTPFLQTVPHGSVTFPGLLALLARDQVESYPALRPHQTPAWHMFLVQLAALALHRAGMVELPDEEAEWRRLLRVLTPEFPEDEPWSLVVENTSKPAFLQPPVPDGVKVDIEVATPDALDLLITSRNHDLKQTVARQAEAQDWVLALVSLQTSEGGNGRNNYGIARMNGAFSSRVLFGLAPLSLTDAKVNHPRLGAWFCRDLSVLLATRDQEVQNFSHIGYSESGGTGLAWLKAWPEGEQLTLQSLDIWFIEVCRRIRFFEHEGSLKCARAGSSTTRINSKILHGAVGDPWALIDKTNNTSLSLMEGDFDYDRLVKLLLSGDWIIPRLARVAEIEHNHETMALVAIALSRGQGKTWGMKSRILPLGGRISSVLGARRLELHTLAQKQILDIGKFDTALRFALALVAARGSQKKPSKEHYAFTTLPRATFDRAVDAIFFEYLWARFEAQEAGPDALQAESLRFVKKLEELAWSVFEAALPSMPCAKLFRPRAEARARSRFCNAIHREFPELNSTPCSEEEPHVVA